MRRLPAFLIVLAAMGFTACHKDNSLVVTPSQAPVPDRGPITVATFTPNPTYTTTPITTAP